MMGILIFVAVLSLLFAIAIKDRLTRIDNQNQILQNNINALQKEIQSVCIGIMEKIEHNSKSSSEDHAKTWQGMEELYTKLKQIQQQGKFY